MKRYLFDNIEKDLGKKIVLLSGPRQVGKTYLSKQLYEGGLSTYLNFDKNADRKTIRDESWDRKSDLVIFDELHKMNGWKKWVKGIFDTEGVRPRILVTGSARFDVFRRGGRESLAGRHYLYRLHPLSVSELEGITPPEQALEQLLARGGFPEPFFETDDIEVARWRKSHLDAILREDLRDLIVIQDLKSIEYLVDRLASQVGSPISYQSLAEDVGVSAPTIKRWIKTLEAMYVIFVVQPWAKKIKGAIQKQPKIYFYDTGRVPEDQPAAKFENLVACALLKETNFREDTLGQNLTLNYLRNKQKKEVDFLISNKSMWLRLVECKLSEPSEPPHFETFLHEQGPKLVEKPVVVCRTISRNKSLPKWDYVGAASWLAKLDA